MKILKILALIGILSVPALLLADYRDTLYFNTKKAGKVPFSHEGHLKHLNTNCSSCHNSIFHISHAKNPVATMADMEKGKSCGACHNKNAPRAPQLSACTTCHSVGDIPMKTHEFGTLTFSHAKHLGMYTCSDCHDGIFRTSRDNPLFSMAQMGQGKSCGVCHEGKTAFSVKGDCAKCHQVKELTLPGDSTFSHKAHIGMSYGCYDCHNKIFSLAPNRIANTMTDMEKGKSCGVCHDGKTAFSVKGDCQKCHKNIKEITFKAFNAKFSHTPHLSLFKCGDCHSGIFIGGARSIRYTMVQMEKGASCGACHDAKSAFGVTSNCHKCHPGTPPDITMRLKDFGTVPFGHNTHRSLFACSDCHNKLFTTGVASKRFTMGDMGKGQSCGACHNGKTAFSAVKDCSKCHPVKEMLFTDDARFNHDKHLGMYGCSDCHNKIYSISPDNKRFKMIQMEKGASCGACHDGKTGFAVKGDCDKCHKSTVAITFNVKETGATYFSHTNHGSLYKCVDCHNGIFVPGKGGIRNTMANMENGKSCGACHDGKTAFGVKNSCTKCHPVKPIKFTGGSAVFSHNTHIASYSCKDCHPQIFIPGKGNKRSSMAMMEQGKSCGACHDDKSAFGVKTNCQKCHPGSLKIIRYELAQTTGSVEFSHKHHLEKGYICSNCHYGTIPSGTPDKRWVMKEMDQGKFCGACHGFSMAFSVKDPQTCERCHMRDEFWRPQPPMQ